jgi:hypothetical protein
VETQVSKLRKFHLSKRAKPVEADALLADIEIRNEPVLVVRRGEATAVAMPYALNVQLIERDLKKDLSLRAE